MLVVESAGTYSSTMRTVHVYPVPSHGRNVGRGGSLHVPDVPLLLLLGCLGDGRRRDQRCSNTTARLTTVLAAIAVVPACRTQR